MYYVYQKDVFVPETTRTCIDLRVNLLVSLLKMSSDMTWNWNGSSSTLFKSFFGNQLFAQHTHTQTNKLPYNECVPNTSEMMTMILGSLKPCHDKGSLRRVHGAFFFSCSLSRSSSSSIFFLETLVPIIFELFFSHPQL